MSTNNRIADTMVQIKNAGLAKKSIIVIKYHSNIIENILICLKESGYISDFKTFEKNNKKIIIIQLKYYEMFQNNFIKNYIKTLSIDEFYKQNEENIFDIKKKITSVNMPSNYAHVIKLIENKSTGGQITFAPYEKLAKYRDKTNNFGILILTTSKGILTHVEAIKQKVGGQIILGVY